MEPATESEPYVTAEIRQRDTGWLLSVTMGVVNPFPSGLDDEIAFYSRPFVSFKAGQHPSCHVQLLPYNNWRATRRILVDPTQSRPRLFVTYWNHFSRDGSWIFEIHLWEVASDFTPLNAEVELILRTSAPPGTRIDGFDSLYLSKAWDIGIAEGQNLKLGTEQDRSTTPIAEEQMETIKDKGSSAPPRDTRAWFLDDHHNIMDSPTTNSSASGLSAANSQHIGITRAPP